MSKAAGSSNKDGDDSLKASSDHVALVVRRQRQQQQKQQSNKSQSVSDLLTSSSNHDTKKKPTRGLPSLLGPRSRRRLLRRHKSLEDNSSSISSRNNDVTPTATNASGTALSSTIPSSSQTFQRCKLCAKKRLRYTQRDLRQPAINNDDMPLADLLNIGDQGFMELIYSIQNQQLHDTHKKSIELEQAESIVQRANRKVKDLLARRQANISHYFPMDLSVYHDNLQSMGKIEWDELKIGALLGVGGFSYVSEITGFKLIKKKKVHSNKQQAAPQEEQQAVKEPAVDEPTKKEKETTASNKSDNHFNHNRSTDDRPPLPEPDDSTTHHTNEPDDHDGETANPRPITEYTKKEWVARKFLAKHAVRTTSTKSASTKHDHATGSISYRYALKHLRPRLKDIYDKRTFNCAAVDLIMEAHILMSLQHPNIIKLRGFATDGPEGYRKGNHNGYFLILDRLPETMEQRLCTWRKRVRNYKGRHNNIVTKVVLSLAKAGGAAANNSSRAQQASRKLDQLLQDRYQVAYEICGAMEYLHDRRMMNRDLKIANIGFDVRGDVKLFDFGLSRWLPTSLLPENKATRNAILDETFHMSSVGTRLYMAPEVRSREPYSTKADVYSFGIVLWEMLALSDPNWAYPSSNPQADKKNAIKASEIMPLCPCWPEPLQQMLQSCVSVTATDRPSFTEIRQLFRRDLGVRESGMDIAAKYAQSNRKGSGDFLMNDSDDNDDDDSEGHDDDEVTHSNYENADDEEADELGSIQGFDMAQRTAPPRRRSTFILNFTDLSWLSSSNSLRMDSSSKDRGGSSRSFR